MTISTLVKFFFGKYALHKLMWTSKLWAHLWVEGHMVLFLKISSVFHPERVNSNILDHIMVVWYHDKLSHQFCSIEIECLDYLNILINILKYYDIKLNRDIKIVFDFLILDGIRIHSSLFPQTYEKVMVGHPGLAILDILEFVFHDRSWDSLSRSFYF